jgi:hypothetical protein
MDTTVAPSVLPDRGPSQPFVPTLDELIRPPNFALSKEVEAAIGIEPIEFSTSDIDLRIECNGYRYIRITRDGSKVAGTTHEKLRAHWVPPRPESSPPGRSSYEPRAPIECGDDSDAVLPNPVAPDFLCQRRLRGLTKEGWPGGDRELVDLLSA